MAKTISFSKQAVSANATNMSGKALGLYAKGRTRQDAVKRDYLVKRKTDDFSCLFSTGELEQGN